MKILFHIACLLLATAMRCQAATAAYVVVPDSKLSMEEAVAKAKPCFGTHKRFRIVSIDWAKAADFQPRVIDGTVYSDTDHPGEWSWFFTCVYSDHDGLPGEFERVLLIRVLDDGSIGEMSGNRT